MRGCSTGMEARLPCSMPRHCYGMAFVCWLHRIQSGVAEARGWLAETFDVAEQRFWLGDFGLYADEGQRAGLDAFAVLPGQNANMHACGDDLRLRRDRRTPLHRARRDAGAQHHCPSGRAGRRPRLEHYHADWSVELGLQPARQDQHLPPIRVSSPTTRPSGPSCCYNSMLIGLQTGTCRAPKRCSSAVSRAWDEQSGGMHYGFAPDGSVCGK